VEPPLVTGTLPKEAEPVEVLVLGTGLYLVKVKNPTGTDHCFKVPTLETQAKMGANAAILTNNMAKMIEIMFSHNLGG
jgi:hypothetical protein